MYYAVWCKRRVFVCKRTFTVRKNNIPDSISIEITGNTPLK